LEFVSRGKVRSPSVREISRHEKLPRGEEEEEEEEAVSKQVNNIGLFKVVQTV
jgi:hypothetical protein